MFIELRSVQNPRNRVRPAEYEWLSARWVKHCTSNLVLYDSPWQVRSELFESKYPDMAGAMRGRPNFPVLLEDRYRDASLGGGKRCARSAYTTSDDCNIS